MTLSEFRALKPGERVWFDDALGEVVTNDGGGTVSIRWFEDPPSAYNTSSDLLARAICAWSVKVEDVERAPKEGE